MIDFVTGLLIAIKETFKAKKTINYPFEKGSLGTRSRVLDSRPPINQNLCLGEPPY